MRPDLEIIQKWIEPDSNVLDLGCGDGSLLHYLKQHKNVREIGLDVDEENIEQCLSKGITVIEQDLNKGLHNFQDDSFDTVLLTHTLQAVRYPELLINDMLRIARKGIITFPNFGNWYSRVYVGFRGRMPVSEFMPYQWYNTPNIHFCTVRDFDDFCAERDIKVISRTVVDYKHRNSWIMNRFPNLFGEIAIYHISR